MYLHMVSPAPTCDTGEPCTIKHFTQTHIVQSPPTQWGGWHNRKKCIRVATLRSPRERICGNPTIRSSVNRDIAPCSTPRCIPSTLFHNKNYVCAKICFLWPQLHTLKYTFVFARSFLRSRVHLILPNTIGHLLRVKFQLTQVLCLGKGSLQCLHLISPLTPMSKVLLELLPSIFSLFAPFHISPSSPAGGTQNKKSWWWEFVELDLETWNLDQDQDNGPLLLWAVSIKSHIQKRISHDW